MLVLFRELKPETTNDSVEGSGNCRRWVPGWRAYQSSVSEDCLCGGMEQVINWADDGAGLARRQGLGAWDKHGVLVCLMRALPVTRYFGHVFSSSVSPLVPHNQDDLPALWAFCSSRAFRDEVKKIDKRVAVTNGSLQKVHFDIEQWRQVAMTQYSQRLARAPLRRSFAVDIRWSTEGIEPRSTSCSCSTPRLSLAAAVWIDFSRLRRVEGRWSRGIR